jgi:iron complex outermembrane receptor protein
MSNFLIRFKLWPTSLVFTAACTFCVAAPVLAQEASAVLQEVIVTAEKRSENLQSVPLALSAFSSENLAAYGISNMTDLKANIPSLVFDEYIAGQPRYFIRGIGNNIDSGSVDDDVGVFVDGVYLGRPAMSNTDFLDLDRVEVLRGPQGTLFGRNVVGGAVSFFSRKPGQDVHEGAEVTYGNYHEIDAKGYVSGPIADNLFGSISAVTSAHDGYGVNTTANNGAVFPTTNLTPGAVTVNSTKSKDVGDTQFTGVRTSLRLVPSESLDIQLNADGSRRRGSGTWAIVWSGGPVAGVGEQSTPWRAPHYPDVGLGDVNNFGTSLDVNWETSIGTLTSISAYRYAWYDSRLDECVLNVPNVLNPALVTGGLGDCYYEPNYTETNHQLTQEFRLASPSSAALKWLVGAYYLHAKDDWSVVQSWAFFFPGFTGQGYFGNKDQASRTNAYALFGNASYEVLHDLTLQAGLRWSRDEKQSAGGTFGVNFTGPWTDNGVPFPPGVGYTTSGSAAWNAFTPAASLNYQVVPDKFVYAQVSRGFKSGGFATELQDKVAEQTPVAPEYAWNYELGLKTEWFEKRARLNVSAFWIDYTNLQVNGLLVQGPGQAPLSILLNAGKTTSKGIESEWNFIVTPAVNIYGNYTYTKTRINETNPGAVGVINVGEELPRAPHNKGLIGASYTAHIGGARTLTARADYSAMSSYASNLPNLADERVPSSKRVDGGLLFEDEGGNLSVELWGKNLTNQVHPNFLTDVGGTVYAKPLDPPRTYGITVRLQR